MSQHTTRRVSQHIWDVCWITHTHREWSNQATLTNTAQNQSNKTTISQFPSTAVFSSHIHFHSYLFTQSCTHASRHDTNDDVYVSGRINIVQMKVIYDMMCLCQTRSQSMDLKCLFCNVYCLYIFVNKSFRSTSPLLWEYLFGNLAKKLSFYQK